MTKSLICRKSNSTISLTYGDLVNTVLTYYPELIQDISFDRKRDILLFKNERLTNIMINDIIKKIEIRSKKDNRIFYISKLDLKITLRYIYTNRSKFLDIIND